VFGGLAGPSRQVKRHAVVTTKIAASAHSSSISEELVINGNIESRGNLHLKGQVQVDIRCQSLFVDEGAQIHGNVMAEEVVIQGSVVGAVRASGVVLQAKSHLEGEVWCQNLTVEQGAIFEGVSRVDRERSVPPA
jgi:cytoskeletal protein CcmA (bactofilin family)